MFPCGIVKKEEEWCIQQFWSVSGNTGTTYKKIPHSLHGIFKFDERGSQWINFELQDYEGEGWHNTFDELEYHYDDISSGNDSEDSEENNE